MLLSLSLLLTYMYAYRGWVRVFTSDGTEVFHYGGCDPHEHVRGEVVEVSFDRSSFLTVKLHTDNEGSHVRSEFCILEAGKVLIQVCVFATESLLNTLPMGFLSILPNPSSPQPPFLQLPRMMIG